MLSCAQHVFMHQGLFQDSRKTQPAKPTLLKVLLLPYFNWQQNLGKVTFPSTVTWLGNSVSVPRLLLLVARCKEKPGDLNSRIFSFAWCCLGLVDF